MPDAIDGWWNAAYYGGPNLVNGFLINSMAEKVLTHQITIMIIIIPMVLIPIQERKSLLGTDFLSRV